MNFTGLSLDQAPPISAPVRFFLTAPIFGMLAALVIFFTDATVFTNRYSGEAIVLVHLFTIGIFGMVMVGALQQMLPVLAGVSLPKPLLVAGISHLLITLGLLGMSFGLWLNTSFITLAASFLLGAGFVTILVAIGYAMKSVSFFTPTVKAMRLSLLFAVIVVLLGMHLLAARGTGNMGTMQMPLADIHSVWGIFGFAGILIIGVAFQVLPMFYVTPGFKKFCKRHVVNIIAVGLGLWALFALTQSDFSWIAKGILLLFFLAFAVVIQLKLSKRRRPVSDVTVWYWRTGSLLLAIGLLLWLALPLFATDFLPVVAVLIGGFILSIITGMLYKIIPFLAWFHLNASGYMQIPTVREFIDERMGRVQLGLHLAAIACFVCAVWIETLLSVGAVSLFFSFALLEFNLVKVVITYRKIKQTPPDFTMNS